MALKPFVTIVIPTLNEAQHIEQCVRSIVADSYPLDRYEMIVMDGGSTDSTRDIVKSLACTSLANIKLMNNPDRVQSAAFNAVMRAAVNADYIIRCDAHAEYPANFISTAIDAALRSDAAIVVFEARAVSKGCFQHAVAFVQTTPFGVGGSEYRLGKRSMFVEHGWHGCFRRAEVLAVGGYDIGFSHNEDSELSHRIHLNGGTVWLDKALSVGYYPRSTPLALARQFWRYGKGRAQNILKHKTPMKPRQLAPVALAGGSMVLLIVAALGLPAALLPLGLYLIACAAVAIAGAIKHRSACIVLATIALPIIHLAWGAGFIRKWLFR